jgi:hypothetical protein
MEARRANAQQFAEGLAYQWRVQAATEMKERIAVWIEQVIERRSDHEFDDLHLGDVDPSFGPRAMWPTAASDCLQTALLLRNDRGLPFTVAIGMSLRSSATASRRRF